MLVRKKIVSKQFILKLFFLIIFICVFLYENQIRDEMFESLLEYADGRVIMQPSYNQVNFSHTWMETKSQDIQ